MNLGFMVHEYSHMLSMYDYLYTKNCQDNSIEEGMADLLGDLVINHYLEKHQSVELDGKRVRIDKPYVTYSGYDMESAWTRTMISGLVSSGKDLEAVGEYVLGDKSKFTEMIFGKETASQKEVSGFGVPKIVTNRKEIYDSPNLDFSNIDRNSIYYRRNCILPLFEIQNKLGDKADVVGVMSSRDIYYAGYIANKYFDGKKFYEVPKEDLEDFLQLLEKQQVPGGFGTPITDIIGYKNDVINDLREEEVKDNSLEILNGIMTLFENEKGLIAGNDLERTVQLAVEEEIQKIGDKQFDQEAIAKRKEMVEKYLELFGQKQQEENNISIINYIKDFEFECEQAEEMIQNSSRQNLLNSDTIKNIAREEGVSQKKEFAMSGIAELEKSKDEKDNTQEQE